MRTSMWIQSVCCTSLLVACAELPAGEGPPAPQTAPSQAALTTTVTRTFTTGKAVDMGWQDDMSGGFLMAVTDTTNQVSSAFVTFNQYRFDPTSQVCTTDPVLGTYCQYTRTTYDALSANISAADLTISGNTARLQTNLAAATNVMFSRCTYDGVTVTTTCVDVLPAGLISLQWSKTTAEYIKSLGATSTKIGPQTIRVAGTRASYSADTSGTVMDTVVQHRPGTMGTSTSLTIDITRTP